MRVHPRLGSFQISVLAAGAVVAGCSRDAPLATPQDAALTARTAPEPAPAVAPDAGVVVAAGAQSQEPANAAPAVDPVPPPEPVADSEPPITAPAPVAESPLEPFEARSIARWCFVASTSDWELSCEDDTIPTRDDPAAWIPVFCHWETVWQEVPWDRLPTSITREAGVEKKAVADEAVAALRTCSLGVTPPEAASLFVALPQTLPRAPKVDPAAPNTDVDGASPEDEPDSDAAQAKAPKVVKRALPTPVASGAYSGPDKEWLETFTDRVRGPRSRSDGYNLEFDLVWYFDANQDGKDEQLALYSGSQSRELDEDGNEDPSHGSITEGFVWRDGRRPTQAIDFTVGDSSDVDAGLTACGLVNDPSSGLVAVVLHNFGDSGCLTGTETLVVAPLDPTDARSMRAKQLTIDPWPVARVRDPMAGVFNRKYDELGTFLGFRPGMTLAEVLATLNSGNTPELLAGNARVANDGTLTLASGPTFRFDSNERLVGLAVSTPTIAEALRVRGFDSPLLDIVGQGANAVARVLGGRRAGTFVFDGAVDKVLGLTLSLEADPAGRVTSFEIQWYPRRRHLEASASFVGLRLGKAPDKLPRALAKLATAKDNGWVIADAGLGLVVSSDADGKRWLDSVTATALNAPAPLLSKEALLGLVGGPSEALEALLGPADKRAGPDTATWLAPSSHRPAWALMASFKDGRVASIAAERIRP